MNPKNKFFLSVITPALNEADNLPPFHARLHSTLDKMAIDWEWIVVDDHSRDNTWPTLMDLALKQPSLKAIRMARNSGSHTAFACGLQRARGDCAVVMAADLQDPPETLPSLLEKWQAGAKIVWAVREEREGETATTKGFSRLFYWIMRRFVGMEELPATGADFFLVDRRVMDVLNVFKESNVSLMALLTWMGFQQDRILYVKQARQYGRSGWSLEKKLKLVIDSITAFTYKPIRLMSYAGVLFAMLGFLYAIVVSVNRVFFHSPVQGYASLMVSILVVGGLQMIMMGVLGEYIWRALDEARNRPRFIIEDEVGFSGSNNELIK